MNRRAFTLIEILTCIVIIAVVAAIATPVFANVRRQAQVAKSLGNLHQMHIGLKLYQMDYDGDGKYGSMAEMGLPRGEYVVLNRFNTPVAMWGSPCGQNPSWEPQPTVIQYDYMPDSGLNNFAAIAPTYKENLVMFVDLNCADHGEPLYSKYIPHLGLGVLLSGALEKPRQAGDARFQQWWAPPQP